MAHTTRIQLEDDFAGIVTKMTDGNIGAVTCMIRTMELTRAIDPASIIGEIGPLLTLDNIGIYGSAIWVLFKNVCKEKPAVMIAVLRATQLGILDKETVLASAVRQNRQADQEILFDPIDIYYKVRERLGIFDPNNTAEL
jgi:hypothetical protein